MTAKFSPFHNLYRREPPQLLRYDKGTTPVSSVDQLLVERDVMLEELRQNLHRAQRKMKDQADLHRKDVTFAIGDHVYLKLRPYRR